MGFLAFLKKAVSVLSTTSKVASAAEVVVAQPKPANVPASVVLTTDVLAAITAAVSAASQKQSTTDVIVAASEAVAAVHSDSATAVTPIADSASVDASTKVDSIVARVAQFSSAIALLLKPIDPHAEADVQAALDMIELADQTWVLIKTEIAEHHKAIAAAH